MEQHQIFSYIISLCWRSASPRSRVAYLAQPSARHGALQDSPGFPAVEFFEPHQNGSTDGQLRRLSGQIQETPKFLKMQDRSTEEIETGINEKINI